MSQARLGDTEGGRVVGDAGGNKGEQGEAAEDVLGRLEIR